MLWHMLATTYLKNVDGVGERRQQTVVRVHAEVGHVAHHEQLPRSQALPEPNDHDIHTRGNEKRDNMRGSNSSPTAHHAGIKMLSTPAPTIPCISIMANTKREKKEEKKDEKKRRRLVEHFTSTREPP